MKKLLILVAVLLGVSTVSAQKFARINLQEVIVAMPEFEEAQKNLETFGKDLQEQMEQIQVEFNNKLADFQKNQATMAASIKQMRQQELEQLQQRFAEFQQIAQQDFQKKESELLEPVQKKANEAVNKVAKNAGYLAVFNTAVPSLAYFDEAQLTDISALVKKELGITETPAAK
jgi:outer membrane protein